LAHLGGDGFLNRFTSNKSREQFGEIVLAATGLSNHGIGALLVVERNIGLKNYIERGIKLDAYLTYDLLVTIFNPKSPLHDGAVIIQGAHVAAAACFLPLTLDPDLSKKLGSRHRAAIGISEETDAVSVVISEETGEISAVIEGEITGNLDGPQLLKVLQRAFEAPEISLSGEGGET
jgi:diadenylate cyclase